MKCKQYLDDKFKRNSLKIIFWRNYFDSVAKDFTLLHYYFTYACLIHYLKVYNLYYIFQIKEFIASVSI